MAYSATMQPGRGVAIQRLFGELYPSKLSRLSSDSPNRTKSPARRDGVSHFAPLVQAQWRTIARRLRLDSGLLAGAMLSAQLFMRLSKWMSQLPNQSVAAGVAH